MFTTRYLSAAISLLLVVTGLSQARRHHIRSGSFPDAPCVATLKKANGQDDKHRKWYTPWEVTDHNWREVWPAGSIGIKNGTLFEGDGTGCRVDFAVDLFSCTFDGSAYGLNFTGIELHHSQPSPLPGTTEASRLGPITWTNCPDRLKVHLDF
ncbi:hypothetical protein DFH28DRAFT_48828 [Melampsora americana]|nr:hypothetical protein DFH28DRAFT_48828 [Melampsora americana]